VQINFTEKESQLQKIFLKSAIGFFYLEGEDFTDVRTVT